jgi:predicted SnoaL-like aldol condensation-catalyzing enzyme
MSADNKSVIERFYEQVWNQGNTDVALDVFADDYVRHDLRPRWTASGTHSGAWGAVEPSGHSVTFHGVNFFRLRDGKVVEIWNHRDDLGLMEQTGVAIYAGARPDHGDT